MNKVTIMVIDLRRSTLRWLLGAAGCVGGWAAQAQPVPYSSLGNPTAHVPYGVVSSIPPASGAGVMAPVASVSPLRDAVAAARSGDVNRATTLQALLTDPVARKVVDWALIDASGTMLSFTRIDADMRQMDGWPREARRRALAEKALETSAASPTQVIAWFGAREPDTAQGAMALAAAYQAQGHTTDAQDLIRHAWRTKTFDADVQARMRARFSAVITPADDAWRLDALLYLAPGSALRALLPLVDADHQQLAAARMALRADRNDAPELVNLVPASLQSDPGLAFDRARYYRKRGMDVIASGFLKGLPAAAPSPDAAQAMWTERRALMSAALRSGDLQGAYAAAASHGMVDGTDYTEAEFFAGWIALTKLRDPVRADRHFANVQRLGVTPITLSRALYWRGRAAETRGDKTAALAYWREGGAYYTAFYGQLSAERAGFSQISLGLDPKPTPEDRARFEAKEIVRAARLLGQAGAREPFRAFVMAIADRLESVEEAALLVDLAREFNDPEIATRAARQAATRGMYLPERGYPVLSTPVGYGLSEPAFTLSIVRQESGFDPAIRSGAGARGLMQLMPTTAAIMARKQGLDYSAGRLDDGDYNLRLGTAYLGQLTANFSGSYLLASAGYNAGPGRAAQWAGDCGDPRQATIDPADFVECIPFSETRNYVMRVMEGLEVYRARLNGGSAPLTLTADLHRGGWAPASGAIQAAAVTSVSQPQATSR